MNDPLDMLGKALAATGAVVFGIYDNQYADPTPCDEMDVRALLNHIVGGAHFWAAIVDGVPFDPATEPDATAHDPAAVYDEAAQRLRDAWSAPGALDRSYELPFGRFPGAATVGMATEEIVVHGWDLARATGQSLDIDPSIADDLLSAVRTMLPPTGRGDDVPFKDAVPVRDDAPALDRLVAYLGRQP